MVKSIFKKALEKLTGAPKEAPKPDAPPPTFEGAVARSRQGTVSDESQTRRPRRPQRERSGDAAPRQKDAPRPQREKRSGDAAPQQTDAPRPQSADGEQGERPPEGQRRRRRRRRPRNRPRPDGEAQAAGGDQRPAQGPDESAPREESQAREREEPRQKDKPQAGEGRTPLRREAPKEHLESDWDPDAYEVPPAEGFTRFHDLDLQNRILHGIADLGFEYCTPIQAGILPHTLAGKDAAGRAQTGTGKTAAFLLTAFKHFLANPLPADRPCGTPRALVIAPTRELAMQILRDAHDLGKYCGIRSIAVYGGMDYGKQQQKLREAPVDLLVATPGRLLDFCGRGDANLGKIEIMIIDEADRMLDMGFIPDVRRIIRATPPKERRQTLLFSATLTGDVIRLASQWMTDPVTIETEPEHVATDSVEQLVYLTTSEQKFFLLYNILKNEDLGQVLIFGNRRDQTRELYERLRCHGFSCALLTGELSQKERLRTLERFRAGDVPIVVATDVAGRGLHVDGIGCVVNYHVPYDAEDYVHRIGRTGRAGKKGRSITFACEMDSFHLPDIEELLGEALPYEHPEPEWLEIPEEVVEAAREERRKLQARRPPPERGSSGGGRSGGGRPGGGRSGGGRSSGGRSGGGRSGGGRSGGSRGRSSSRGR